MRYIIKEMEYGAVESEMEFKNIRELRKAVKGWGWKSYSIKKINKPKPSPQGEGEGERR